MHIILLLVSRAFLSTCFLPLVCFWTSQPGFALTTRHRKPHNNIRAEIWYCAFCRRCRAHICTLMMISLSLVVRTEIRWISIESQYVLLGIRRSSSAYIYGLYISVLQKAQYQISACILLWGFRSPQTV